MFWLKKKHWCVVKHQRLSAQLRGLARADQLALKQEELSELRQEVQSNATPQQLKEVEARLQSLMQERSKAASSVQTLRQTREALASASQLSTRVRVAKEQLQARAHGLVSVKFFSRLKHYFFGYFHPIIVFFENKNK